MKYKCDVEGCDFECESESELIEHFETKHKDELTNYCINWIKSKGLTPIETCKVCGDKIKVKTIELHDGHRVYNGLVPLFTGICSSSCQEKLLTDYMWKYEPCHGNNFQCLYERNDSWTGIPNKGRKRDPETKAKISEGVKFAIACRV